MKLKTDKNSIGLRINGIRLKLSDTLEEFGKRFNADKSNILRWEQGKTLPNKKRLSIIANLGGISLNELLYGSIDEFLENNIDVLIENSDFPIKLTNEESHITYRQVFISYIKSKFMEYPMFKDVKNSIDYLDTLCVVAITFFNKYIKDDINNIKKTILEHKHTTIDILKTFPTEFDIKLFNISESTLDNLYSYDNLMKYISNINKDEITNDYLMLNYLRSTINKNSKKSKFNLIEIVTLYISLSDIITYDINLHTDNYTGFDYFLKENTYIVNKYNIDNYDIIVGLKIEQENSLFYLANYQEKNKVPLNTEAKYFILNHDNTYQISKITEIPDCKYIAPIVGKLE